MDDLHSVPTGRAVVAEWATGDRAVARRQLTELALAARSGSERLMAELLHVVSETGIARRSAADILFDVADIDDAEQSTLLVLTEKIAGFEGRSEFTSWLRTVARNEALQVLRRRKRREHDPLTPDTDVWTERMSSIVADRETLARAVADLPTDYRDALLLRAEGGFDYATIAERTGVPIGTVRSRISRARSMVARALGHPAGD